MEHDAAISRYNLSKKWPRKHLNKEKIKYPPKIKSEILDNCHEQNERR